MEATYYEQYAQAEDTHWWFRGRRAIVGDLISSLPLPHDPRVTEIGCGTGGNLEMLARFGPLTAVEPDQGARRRADQRGVVSVLEGGLPDGLPIGEPQDLVVALDVIEHVADDDGALRAMADLLTDKGHLVITVPAYQWLWSHHDEINHHYRRYRRSELVKKMKAAGLQVIKASYFNTTLLPVVAATRLIGERMDSDRTNGNGVSGDDQPGSSAGRPGGEVESNGHGDDTSIGDDLTVPPMMLNNLLERVFSAERLAVTRFSLPVGVSIVAIATRC